MNDEEIARLAEEEISRIPPAVLAAQRMPVPYPPLIDAEDLHTAADRVAEMTADRQAGLTDDALEDFIGGTAFFHPTTMNVEQAIAYGILIGAVARRDKRDPR